ncbi:hypothetical protein U5801_01425 [Lamprobacter modestohalophilus]|uniref:Uncharacterized protein n=1 Tax=Lamprobacter modestohalophilus TaxID=1064514 RepID=A0A9X0WD22_9GAMM|nr:hypothetical protein [Lamprobacter modestohalophilus]MCF7976402.1 hypothetical protein [Chromatiaceae bacterium]MBK1621187.1 hypothetical protein [Lamprobacter modestohalophilus]MCF7993468.1 hypothetical protein [Chromatiaceae bacterium]MCF8003231.1 hypothetical protein [Chromatiaceae bacterium]MCF8015014.1 hypothetical protein [Chromatiaceae bacterium]
MKQTLLQEKYPIYTLEVSKDETRFADSGSIIAYLKECIDAHDIASYIGEFDHMAHTQSLANGEIAEGIESAKHILFCFGTKLPDPHVMAVRPRSIGVVDQGDRFTVTFLEAPMPPANEAMERWVKAIVEQPAC